MVQSELNIDTSELLYFGYSFGFDYGFSFWFSFGY
jgi:hypothetical protein